MHPSDWLKAWEKNEIPFNQELVNPYLKEYSYLLKSEFGNKIFVPLCGKSTDMLWLSQHGFSVVGIELSLIAVRAFFKENHIKPHITKIEVFDCYSTENIEIFCGDYFRLTSNEIGKINAVYDRAALSVFPEKLRFKYAQHLLKFLPSAAKILLITTQYDCSRLIGPPYSISKLEINRLFINKCKIQIIDEITKTIIDIPQHLIEIGIKKLVHRIYLLETRVQSY